MASEDQKMSQTAPQIAELDTIDANDNGQGT